MNWDQIEGKWKQYEGAMRQKWGKLTDSDMNVIAGKETELVGKIQERYGIAKEAAQKQVDEYIKNLNELGAPTQGTEAETHQKSRRAGS
jgi:uncharacterized protein YjbJ (UPF0337 family)